ncbi:MAG TPA: response regulator [Polyangia bacterium]|nr:response regulator [Polyangia bacterium]
MTTSSSHIPRPLRALLVEDSADDAELVIRELRRGGYEPITRRVQTAVDLTATLTNDSWDVIISDYSMPQLSAPDAFAIVRSLNLDIPFIIVSGTVGEEVAVTAMRTGVHDFLLKGQLGRLVAAIERELRESAMRAERRKIQEQLLISDRMASVGTLAAGVAHEINNPLSVVAGNLQVVRQDAEAIAAELEGLPPEARGTLGGPMERVASAVASLRAATSDAEEAAERVRMIVRDLRVFSRPEEDRREPVDVHRVIESSIRMARNELRHRAKVVRRFGTVPLVDANEARLGQVFLNLLVNAAQAIPDGRTDLNTITITTAIEDGMVTIDIADTGAGIAAEVLPRIFDVFFTTKPIGVGTGLGLAICHRILTAMEGRIEVQSRLGEGTTFRVALRRARSGRTIEMPAVSGVVPEAGRTGTVLVIEDEPALGRVLQRLLAPHRVNVVTRASEALGRVAAGESFDLILCDLMMPEMTGMDFHAELSRSFPAVAARVVFMSGGAFTPGAREFLERTPNRRIDKPIDTARLRQLVEEALARKVEIERQ